jgi:hypothetical protein
MNSLFLAVLLSAAAPPFEVQTLDGKTLVGRLVELTADRLSVETADGRVSLETERLLQLSSAREAASAQFAPGVVVELVDGSTILGRQYVVHADRAKITLPDATDLEVPTSALGTVLFQQKSPPSPLGKEARAEKSLPSPFGNGARAEKSLPSPFGRGAGGEGALAEEWSRLAGMKVQSDLLVVHKDQTIDYHKGVLHDVTEDVVRFDLDGDVLPVKRSKIYGLAYHHGAAAELPPAVCRITDASGSQWSAKTLSLAEKLAWTTPTGLSVSQPLEKIVKIDFSGGKLVYLSDLKPNSVAWTPYFRTAKPLSALAQFYAPRFDHNFDSSALRLGGTQYNKGLALRSRTEIVYRLPAPFKRFQATVGIDDAVRPSGKVRLVVRGDDKVLLQAVVAGTEAPQAVDLDVTGVRRLVILVDFGNGLTVGDHLLLCNARLSK